jgi:hypothetical protein
MRIVITSFLSFSSVQDVLNIGADDTRRINEYAACLRLKPSNDFAKKAVRFIKSILFG